MGWENWGISTFSLLQNSDVGTKEAFLVQLHRHITVTEEVGIWWNADDWTYKAF